MKTKVTLAVLSGVLAVIGWFLIYGDDPSQLGARETSARATAEASRMEEKARSKHEVERRVAEDTEVAHQRLEAAPALATEQSIPSPSGRRILLDQQRANIIRKRLIEARRARTEASGPEEPVARMPAKAAGEDGLGQALGSYMADVMQEQYVPLLEDCANKVKGEFPDMAGSLVLQTTLGGSAAIGGVVEDVQVKEGATLKSEELVTCVRESFYALVLDAPPEDDVSIPVDIPIEFKLKTDEPG